MPPLSEFQLIRQFFSNLNAGRAEVVLGVGDDAALLDVGGAELLAVCIDTLTEGVHFPAAAPAAAVGHKALAVNLSDLAAMGARPAWVLLALALPEVDAAWLSEFKAGFQALAERHGVALIGGDTTRGARSATVTALGQVAADRALRRRGARPGDRIYVSGTVGDAAAGLRLWQSGERSSGGPAGALIERLHYPTPRLALGAALGGVASAAIDVSDGLAADLGHILEQSGVGARLEVGRLPLSVSLQQLFLPEEARALALSGGDDYELCFTAPVAQEAAIRHAAEQAEVAVTAIGTIEAEPGLRLVDGAGELLALPAAGYQHFQAEERP